MSGQLGFSDHVVLGGRSRRADNLGQIACLIDWSAIEALLRPLQRGRRGRPPYPVLVLFKVLLLQRWYGLSDEAMEDGLADRQPAPDLIRGSAALPGWGWRRTSPMPRPCAGFAVTWLRPSWARRCL
jgi:hypothetical protein